MLEIYLVRHGQTDGNLQGFYQSRIDSPLNRNGKIQVLKLAERLKNTDFQIVLSSDLSRALQTAEILLDGRNIPLRMDPGLSELNLGMLDGMLVSDMEKEYPDFVRKWRSKPSGIRWPGGESLSALQKRAWKVVSESLLLCPEGRILVVSHAFTLISIICKFLRISLNSFRIFRLSEASLTVITKQPSGFQISVMNDTSHMQ
jgi:broad specificity phosphatase PhoE